ncbi:MAG: TonB-dependent receptor plug domain-containing protein [Gemmatimonadota bacterium]
MDVGYDTQPVGDVTGSVTSISTRQFAGSKPTGLIEILRGRVAGLQIIQGPGGRGFVLRIRGMSSLTSQVEPLLVVDGVSMSSDQADNALAGISSDDVRQVDVLKDVASTSIYGMRGAGGVIIVTTRR